ncbi:hypothetical protein KAR91_12040 [Candidatus Pacearchaeota archaeon]|nr:hypothetical protein [Candidatus Pacearchaeota archaeon]
MSALKELEKIKGDAAKWKWLQQNQDKGLLVQLDNDGTFVIDLYDESVDDFVDFDEYVGWSRGVCVLLEAMGIKAEPV